MLASALATGSVAHAFQALPSYYPIQKQLAFIPPPPSSHMYTHQQGFTGSCHLPFEPGGVISYQIHFTGGSRCSREITYLSQRHS